MTMNEIRESLVASQSLKCTEHLRTILIGENGLAGLLILEGNWTRCKKIEVLDTYVAKYKTLSKWTVQELHALHNLCELLKNGGLSAPEQELAQS